MSTKTQLFKSEILSRRHVRLVTKLRNLRAELAEVEQAEDECYMQFQSLWPEEYQMVSGSDGTLQYVPVLSDEAMLGLRP